MESGAGWVSDFLYAEKVLEQVGEFGYNKLIANETKTIEENASFVERLFFG